MTDIQSKYQKLAAEYAKLRAQVPVLKKAVLDEQAKGSELVEQIKGKDQSVRKFEQEVDSLSFRNQQLTARVELLQREIESPNVKTKKTKKNNTVSTLDSVSAASAVLSEELQSKITENASLHTRLSEAEVRQSAAVAELQRHISQLEFKGGQHQSVLDESLAKNKQQLEKLQEDKMKLEVKFQKRDTECRDVTLKAETLEEKLSTVEEKFDKELSEAKRIIDEKLQFIDTEHQSLNSLNLVAFDREHQIRCKELVAQAYALVKDLVQALLNFYTYCEQRTRVYPIDSEQEPLTAVNKQYCAHLHDNAVYIRPVEQTFKAFSESVREDTMTTLETADGLDQFAIAFDKLCNYVSKLLPYQLLSIEEEGSTATCTVALQSSNLQLGAALKQWHAALVKLNTYVSLLAFQSSSNCDHPRSSQAHLLVLTSQAVAHVHQTVIVVSKCYQKKLTVEHELPTVSEKLKITNECALSSLLTLVTVFSQMSTFLSSNLAVLSKCVQAQTSVRSHPAATVFRQRATNYITSLQRPCPQSVPYETALHNRNTLYSSTESRDSLTQQVVSLQERVTKLEQEKEHWMLESKLLQRKYEKECQKISSAEQRIKMFQADLTGQALNDSLISHSVESSPDSHSRPNDEPAPGGPGLESMLGRLTRAMSEEDDVDTREEFIKNYYSKKIADVTKQIQLADSKAVNFHAECRALSKQLKSGLKERDKMNMELEAANETAAQFKDELQTTSRSYEDQLKTMTEHLTGMNDKLTSQADEINSLKHQLTQNTKGTRRGFLGKHNK